MMRYHQNTWMDIVIKDTQVYCGVYMIISGPSKNISKLLLTNFRVNV